MKIKLILLLCLFTANALFGQDLKINVTNNNTPLGYAYLYLNTDLLGIADKDGIFNIPHSEVNVGDSISASYAGLSGNGFVVTKDINDINIDLVSSVEVDDVVVSIEPEKLLNKYTAHTAFYHYGTNHIVDYSYKVSKKGVSIKDEKGELSLVYLYKKNPEIKGDVLKVFAMPGYNLAEDINFDKELIISTHNAISLVSQYYKYMLQGRYGSDKTLQYKGMVNNSRVFAATSKIGNNINQITCYFDKENKKLVEFELSILEFDDNENLIIERNSKVSIISNKILPVASQYYINKISETIKYKDMVLETKLSLSEKPWKFDKKIDRMSVADTKELLDCLE